MFLKVAGSKGYPQLYFFASLCSLIYYVYFSVRGHKKNEPYNIYRTAVVVTLVASFSCFLAQFYLPLQRFNVLLLYTFVISVMTVDLIGLTLGPIVLQRSVNPVVFRQVFQNIVTMEVVARIGAAAIVWLFSQLHGLTFVYPVTWLLLIAHYILFGITLWRMRVSELGGKHVAAPKESARTKVLQALHFMFANPLVRVAMIVMLWSTATKFIVEYLFYQAADQMYGSARQLALFLSITSIIIYVLSFLMNHFGSSKVTARLQLSTLLSIQPVNLVLLVGLTLLFPPFWPLVLLNVTYNIVHWSIQLPMSRQCLVPVPRKQRGTIVSLISILVSFTTMFVSGGISLLKSHLQMQELLALLLLLGAGILFVTIGLDSFYIRNLWSFLREATSGTWQNEPQLQSLSPAQLGAVEEADTAYGAVELTDDLTANPILEVYAFSHDQEKLRTASIDHRQLLDSRQTDSVIGGLKICFATGFPWFAQCWSQAAASDDAKVSAFAQTAAKLNRELSQLNDYSSAFRRKIKVAAMELMEAGPDESNYSILKSLLNLPDHGDAESFMTAFAGSRFSELRPILLQCIVDHGDRLSIAPIVQVMCEREYKDSALIRDLLEALPFGKRSAEVRSFIHENLSQLKRDQFSLSGQTDARDGDAIRKFMHTLFLEVYRLSPGAFDAAIVESISELPSVSQEDRSIFTDMHLSFLKRSDQLPLWQQLMT
jgi:hypothetical protein